MTDDSHSHERRRNTRRRWTLRTVSLAGGRIIADLLILALWVGFLGLAFLSTGWPRWGFYTLLVLGIVLYVTVTAAWTKPPDASSDAVPPDSSPNAESPASNAQPDSSSSPDSVD